MFNLKGGMVLALIALSILLSTASAEEAKNELQYIEKSTKD
jgi:small neutral amino acid transporter SnatA (MarC family)